MNGLGQSSVSSKSQSHLFSRVSTSNAVEYSTFDTPVGWHGTIDSGYLIPICCIETVPGDILKLKSSHLIRPASALQVPIMQNMYVCYEFYYVKYRYIWDNWKKLMGEQRNPNDSTDYLVPTLNTGSSGVERRSIFDCFGIRANGKNYEFNTLGLRAYNLIYNYWYRDQNLQTWKNIGGTGTTDSPVDEFGDSDQLSNYQLLKRNKSHDYFTSMLPWQQKGDPVIMNLSTGTVPVFGNGMTLGLMSGSNSTGSDVKAGLGYSSEDNLRLYPNVYGLETGNSSIGTGASLSTRSVGVTNEPEYSGLIADLSNVNGISISDFRTAIQVQAIKELEARTGTRYQEKIEGGFKVKIADAELGVPEILASYKQAFYTTPIAQTSATTETINETPQGNLAAVSHAFLDRGYDFVKAFDDFGVVIGILSITTDNYYQQGLHRKWSRKTKYDFYHPLLQHISEQPVKRKELIILNDDDVDENGNSINESTLGYQEAWAEYKYGENIITGDFVSNPDDPSISLDRYHLAEYFDPDTTKLNGEFIEYNIPLDRVLAITGTEENPQPQFLVDSSMDCKFTRPMARYSVPWSFGGRF
ncbi:MAG: hypothetical protein IJY61_04300 [Candidatus Gastranaerophilales bacterium]|nr:hypothetical protein [Candidatus Gastranaerophilales bacterium]